MACHSIDWTLILINNQIPSYLSKPDLFNLSLTSKLIRIKLIPIYYNTIKISDRVLFNQPNYFMNKQIIEFGADDSLWDLWFITINWFDNDLAFKEAHIYPFIDEAIDQVKPQAIHCKCLNFENLGKAYYFLFPISYEFPNLRTLIISLCVIPMDQLCILLKKLTQLEVLDLNNSDIIKSHDIDPTKEITFPQSLHSLTYINIRSWSTTLPMRKPLKFLKSSNSTYNLPDHELLPQLLPQLKYFSYFSININHGLIGFLQINSYIEDLTLPINLLSSIKTNNELLKSVKKMNLFAIYLHTEEVKVDKSIIPNFPNLEVLILNLRTDEQLEFSELLIKNCPKLSRIYVNSEKLEFYKFRYLTKIAKNLKYFNGIKCLNMIE